MPPFSQSSAWSWSSIVSSSRPGAAASDDDARLVLALAEQASLAIDNARLYAIETRKREAAEAARYSAPLVDYLWGLTAAAHTVIYGPHAARERGRDGTARRMWLTLFPRTVRRFWREMLLAAALVSGGGLLAALAGRRGRRLSPG